MYFPKRLAVLILNSISVHVLGYIYFRIERQREDIRKDISLIF